MSSDVIRWLHVSDFHVGKDGYEQRRLFREILLEIERWKNSHDFRLNYVFITGDIANKGLAKEYETFRADFLQPLRDTIDASTVVIPIPGNHDVARPSSDALGREALLLAGSRFFDGSKEGRAARDQVIPRFKQYKRLMSADVSPDWLASSEGVAVHVQNVGATRVGVVGLNTAWLSKGDEDKDQLTPGYRLVEAALQRIDDCAIKFVLGHHPLAWWHEREEAHIRNLFARSHVIYLHGHLHRSEGRVEDGGSDDFLVLQAGAAFQARDGEPWVNGFSWAEADLATAEVRVSPRYWDSTNHEWPPLMGSISQKRRIGETDWWRFQLPGRSAIIDQWDGDAQSVHLPGWQVLTTTRISAYASAITPETAQRFFDGAEPDWGLALSPHFPVRVQAQGLLQSVLAFAGTERPQFALIRGPTAEGKSMALRQTVAAALKANTSLTVLWHLDETAGLDVDTFASKLLPGSKWLIASDHGDLIVTGLREFAQRLRREGRSDIQFVVAVHDADWRVAKGDSALWASFTHFQQAVLGGLPDADATSIARAWLAFDIGTRESPSHLLTVDGLAEQLSAASASEGLNREGALLGALLTLRHGSDLREHVRGLLQRLDAMQIPGSGTLGRAFRFIAAMHAEGLDFLSRSVLREALACDQRALQLGVLGPLASEAAAGGGTQLRTRHRRIARATMELVENEEGEFDQPFVELVGAAIRLRRIKGDWLDALSDWEYTLAKHFFDHDRRELALKIAARILEVVPDNAHYLVNLARLKRESGDFEGAINVLSAFTPQRDDRGFWAEWATSCGMQEDYLSNVWLHAYSISDELSSISPKSDHAGLVLAGMAQAFAGLHTQFGRQEFIIARGASTALGLRLSDNAFGLSLLREHEKATETTDKPKDASEAITRISQGLAAARECGGMRSQLLGRIGEPSRYKFAGLIRCIANQSARPVRR
jgi:tetratricopeptide (TPR) repeat protein